MVAPQFVSNRQPHKLAIIELVRGTTPGTLITDAQINRATGAVMKHWNSAMQAARRVLAVEDRIILKREKGIGYLHLKDEELAGASDRRIRRARNQVKVAVRIVGAVKDFAAMDPRDQVVHMQTSALASIVYDTLSPKRKKEIDSTVANGIAGVTAAAQIPDGKPPRKR